MLNQYTNIEEIKSLQSPKRGERVTDKTAGLLSDVGNFKYELVDLAGFYGSEIHIYSGENWITGDVVIHDRMQTAGYENYLVRDCITYHFVRGESIDVQ